ncbi:MAG: hypothetical protein ACAI35_14260 [Candidatus Methylacidiphilales bacterium]|nr:hypothetical protein [Candidatus Methylacidiphilales bacterium]
MAIAALVTTGTCCSAADSPLLAGGSAGRLHFVADGEKVCTFAPFAADGNWNFYWPTALSARAGSEPSAENPYRFRIKAGDQTIDGEFKAAAKDGNVDAAWTFSSASAMNLEQLAVAADFNLATLAGGTWEADETKGVFPDKYNVTQLFANKARNLVLKFPGGRTLKFAFAQPASITLQDNRQWGKSDFTLRIGQGSGKLAAKESRVVAMSISVSDGLAYTHELPMILKPVVLEANAEWVPLQSELDIEPGSALDLSTHGLTDGPCGSKGRVIVNKDGHFAYKNDPDKARRFYGVNFCFSSMYLPREQTDKLLDRLVRLGYNTVRVHHYEGQLTKTVNDPGFDWDPAKVDQLDYFMAGCAKRGLWITTDLFVSRPVSGKQIGLQESRIAMDKYKVLVPVYEPAFEDLKTFSRKLLDRVNPYTGKRVADDPALAWISLINEGPANHLWGHIKQIPEWTSAWNRWLAARYPTREELEIALGDLGPTEDPARNTVGLPGSILAQSRRARLCQVFVTDTERAMCDRLRAFLRDELKCQALLTNVNNAGPGMVPLQAARNKYDYVDEHFYVDHPSFLEKSWQLPSECPNTNPIEAAAPGASGVASVRIYGKPFTVSEFNYSGPGRFRGVGGILTSAMAALQDWDCVWRFAYSHSAPNLFEPKPAGYFDMASDPLSLASDRLAVLLYLRRDVAPASNRLAMVLPRDLLRNPPQKLSASAIRSAAWITQIGNIIVSETDQALPGLLTLPAQSGGSKEAVADLLKQANLPEAASGTDKLIRSETGEISILPKEGVLVIDTPKSAGGYAEPGKTILAEKSGVQIDGLTTGATVFVNSLDPSPIRTSRRLLVTHLTDLQNTGVRYGEAARQTLYEWGKLPYLVRDGAATVHISLAEPGAYSVYALTTSGKRLEKLETKVEAGQLVFTVAVRGKDGARMLYDVVRN